MDRFPTWFWRHFRDHFFLAAGALVAAFLEVCVLGPVIVLAALLGQPARYIPMELATQTVSIVLIVTLAITATPKLRRPMRAWIAGDRSDPEAVRNAALVSAERMSMRGLLFAAPFWLPTSVVVFGRGLGVTGAGYLSIALVATFIFFVGGFIVGTGLRLLMLPLVEEVDPAIPADRPPTARMWSLQYRVPVAVFAASLSTGMGAAGAAYFWGNDINSVVLAGYAGAFAMSVYVTTLVVVGVVQPTLRPLADLADATRRVREGDFSQTVAVTSSDELGDLVQSFNAMTVGLRQREALQSAFGSYVDPALAQRLLTQDSSVFDGELVDVSVFFADVRGFTTYAATVEPEAAVAELNRLFSIVVPAIRDAGGHPNRYTGDGVLAVFGTPEPLTEHADAAVCAARTIQAGVRDTFGEALRVGIGINTGKVVAGTIGAAGKLDFTVIGDTVNVAARIEEHTKQTGDHILVTQATLDRLTAPERVIDRGEVHLRGKSLPVRLFALPL